MTSDAVPPPHGGEGKAHAVSLTVNGARADLEVPTTEFLAATLQTRLGLDSVRVSCGLGICGSCTVLVDNRPASACLMLTAAASGRHVQTAEALEHDGEGTRVVEAFERAQAYQCSYCIPGFAVAARALLADPEVTTVEDAARYLSGNLCRCGTYPQILEAARALLEG